MIDWQDIWGSGEQLNPLQMGVRAAVVFLITLVFIRFGGVRIFRERSGLDVIIMIVMGSVLGRGIVGASPFWSTIAAAFVMIIVHRVLGWLTCKSKLIEILIKGKRHILFENGKVIRENLRRAHLTDHDLFESLRLETKMDNLEKVEKAFIETNGRISFILKK
jgi:uncharacterized membrane protein YcaP (DUF421 family)